MPAMDIANIAELQKYNVNLENFEKIKQTLYDSAAYPAAGVSTMTFFQLPIGATVGSTNKTLEDTNMQLAGQLPTNQLFLVESVEVIFFPTDPSVTADLPAAFGAQAAADIINDAYVFYRSGSLVFEIGSKDYLREAPLQKFPGKTRFDVMGALADASTAGSDFQSRIAYATAAGRPYLLKPPVLLIENQNFSVQLRWPNGVQALPSGNPARIFTVLDGILFRRAQ